MNFPFDPWKRKLAWWLVPFVFCLVNLLALGIYRAYFADRVPELQETFEVASNEVLELREETQRIELFLETASGAREGVDELYRDRFSSEAERFTKALFEVKNLARQAGLNPGSINYPRTDINEYGLIKRNIEFGVEGTYDQLRTFINFLELSGQFMTLESVALGSRGEDLRNPSLGIRLSLSTIFIDEKNARKMLNEENDEAEEGDEGSAEASQVSNRDPDSET